MNKPFHLAMSMLLGCVGIALEQSVYAQTGPDPVGFSTEQSPIIIYDEDTYRSVSSRIYVKAEYLAWWFKKSPVPVPLATFAPVGSPADAKDNAGALGNSDTTTVLGGKDYDTGVHSGARFTADYWFDPDRMVGISGSYFFLGSRQFTRSVGSEVKPDLSTLTAERQQQQQQQGAGGGGPFLTIPFFDVTPGSEFVGQENVYPILMGPGPGNASADFTGGATLRIISRLQGADLNGVFSLYEDNRMSVVALAGFRWLKLREDLVFTTSRVSLPPEDLEFIATRDEFHANNNFYAGQIGLRAEYRLGNAFVSVVDKLALGSMHQQISIDGSATVFDATTLTNSRGGFFALPTNIGSHTRNRFALANELTLMLGYDLGSWVRVTGGYDLLNITHVVRPGNQIDRIINTSQAPIIEGSTNGFVGPVRPGISFQDSSFWAQGINFGLEFRF